MPSSNCCFLISIQISQEAGKVDWYFHLFKNFVKWQPTLVLLPREFHGQRSLAGDHGSMGLEKHDWTTFTQKVKGFRVFNEAEVDVFLEFSCFFYDPTDVGNLISDFSAFSKSRLNIWKFSVYVLLKPSLENFEHYFTSCVKWVQLCSSLNILWHCPSLGLEWKLTFSSPVATEFFKFVDILSATL